MRCLLLSLALAAAPIGGAIAAAQPPARHGAFPSVSPDGRSVLFQRDSGGRSWAYVMNADGSNQHVVPGAFVPMSWFPDSKRLFVGIPGETRNAPIRIAS